jgi:predicted acetyltransferase
MEIRYLRQEENIRSRALYEEIFVEDEKAFVDAYYRIKAADNQILVAEEAGEIISMLHRNPYSFCLRGEKVEADYIVAVATRLSWRHQGLMRQLLTQALCDMEAQKRPFTFLMPADEAIYTPFDFRLMGNDDEEHLAEWSVEKLAEEYDLYVQKDEAYVRRHINWSGRKLP